MQAMVFVGVCTLFIMLYAEVLSIKPFVEWTHQMLRDWFQICEIRPLPGRLGLK